MSKPEADAGILALSWPTAAPEGKFEAIDSAFVARQMTLLTQDSFVEVLPPEQRLVQLSVRSHGDFPDMTDALESFLIVRVRHVDERKDWALVEEGEVVKCQLFRLRLVHAMRELPCLAPLVTIEADLVLLASPHDRRASHLFMLRTTWKSQLERGRHISIHGGSLKALFHRAHVLHRIGRKVEAALADHSCCETFIPRSVIALMMSYLVYQVG
jgi:hypothetical protein